MKRFPVKSNYAWRMVYCTIMLFLVISVFCLSIAVYQLKSEVKQLVIVSLDEVGIAQIDAETIVSAKFDSTIPTYIYEVSDYSVVEEILSSLNGAVFQKCDGPDGVIFGIETLYIQTDQAEYVIGEVDGIFLISINGTENYYHCSKRGEFVDTLCRVQGR